jgi:hypothetical protein
MYKHYSIYHHVNLPSETIYMELNTACFNLKVLKFTKTFISMQRNQTKFSCQQKLIARPVQSFMELEVKRNNINIYNT